MSKAISRRQALLAWAQAPVWWRWPHVRLRLRPRPQPQVTAAARPRSRAGDDHPVMLSRAPPAAEAEIVKRFNESQGDVIVQQGVPGQLRRNCPEGDGSASQASHRFRSVPTQ
ncbi:MAG: hypothetical protein R2856_03395 [Caldilineaceae bacterium]